MIDKFVIRHQRIVTKERPQDRFLAAQYRELGDDPKAPNGGTFLGVLEITNPWFPNAQIGQTIVNTVIREYRRGEHPSPLQNFEIALRKTNEVLAHIAQTGETDWIGHLHSLLGVVHGGQLFLAQTGRARGYLWRAGKLIDLAEGLVEDTDRHPLTTYTNITTGQIERGDRLLLASSLLAETLGEPDLKTVLAADELGEVGRTFVRVLQTARVRRLFAVIADAAEPDAPRLEPETLYLDQSQVLADLALSVQRTWSRHLLPQLKKGGATLGQAARTGATWTRDWLVPRAIHWGRRSQALVRAGGKKLAARAQPALRSAREKLDTRLGRQRLNIRLPRFKPAAASETAGVRVHHYSERAKGVIASLLVWLKKIRPPAVPINLPRIGWRPSRRQIIILGVAVLVIAAIALSASLRSNGQQKATEITAAEQALAAAKTAQQEAERAFLLSQSESAKTQYLAAITAAEQALASPATAAEAQTILNQSQALYDDLIQATRLNLTVPLATLGAQPAALAVLGDQMVALAGQKILEGKLADGALTERATLAEEPVAATGNARVGDRWYLPKAGGGIWEYDLSAQAARAGSIASGAWEQADSLADFGDNLYLLDIRGGQLWKHSRDNATFSAGRGYLAAADPNLTKNVIDLTIDGDVFFLKDDGTVAKYTRGVRDDTWKLAGVPSPWDDISSPRALFSHEDADRLYLFEGKTDPRPARLLAFAKTGAFAGQLLFPRDWEVALLAWDAVKKTGLAGVGRDIYQFDWNQ